MINKVNRLDITTILFYLTTLAIPFLITFFFSLETQGDFALLKNNISLYSLVLVMGLPQSLLIISSKNLFSYQYLKILSLHLLIVIIILSIFVYYSQNANSILFIFTIIIQILILIKRAVLIPFLKNNIITFITYGNIPLFLIILIIIYLLTNKIDVQNSYFISLALVYLYTLIIFKNNIKINFFSTEKLLIKNLYTNSILFIVRDFAYLFTLYSVYEKLEIKNGSSIVGALSLILLLCSCTNIYLNIFGPKLVSLLIQKRISGIQFFKKTLLSNFLIIIIFYVTFNFELLINFINGFANINNFILIINETNINNIFILFILESWRLILINYYNGFYSPKIPAFAEAISALFAVALLFLISISLKNILFVLILYSCVGLFILLIFLGKEIFLK